MAEKEEDFLRIMVEDPVRSTGRKTRPTPPVDDIMKKVIEKGLSTHFKHISQPSKQQVEEWKSLLMNFNDTFAILPTGHGKSLIYETAIDIAFELCKSNINKRKLQDKNIVIVVTPLLSIINDQVDSLVKLGVPAINLSLVENESNEEKQLLTGEYQIIYGTPEAWIKQEKWTQLLKTEVYRSKVLLLVADEAHCAPKW